MSLADIVLTAIGSEDVATEDVAEIRVSINANEEVDPSGPRTCGSIYVKKGGVFVMAGSYQDPPESVPQNHALSEAYVLEEAQQEGQGRRRRRWR